MHPGDSPPPGAPPFNDDPPPVVDHRHMRTPPRDDMAAATAARLRQMGVSFISPEELRGTARTPDYGAMPVANHMYYPPPPPPAELRSEATDGLPASTNSSLAINSAALKYLDDRQLTHMAKKHPSAVAAAKLPTRNDQGLLRQIMAGSGRQEAQRPKDECLST